MGNKRRGIMIVIDREYAIQLMMKDDLYNVPRLQQILFLGFLGYDNLDNEELLTIYIMKVLIDQ